MKKKKENRMKKLVVLLTIVTLATNGFAAFKIVAIPDTQRMAETSPAEMKGQTEWITNNVISENIAFVTHLGDIVDNDESWQWDNATDALDLLDGVVPYSVCLGNHDLSNRFDRAQGSAGYIDRFGSSRYSGYSWYKGSHRDLDHYQIFSADGRDWLHLNLEYMPDSESLLWAQRVLDAHPDLPVLLSTHSFLSGATGELSNDPSSSQFGIISNGGESQWFQFVKQNDQIFLVMNGHHDGVVNTNIVNTFGNDVFMMCVNFQYAADDDAHFRILEFDSANDEINATTYDPNTNDWLSDSANQFTLSMDFSTRLTNFHARQTFSTIQAANLTVVENNLNNSNNSVTVTIPAGQSTADISVVPVGTTDYTDHSNGDYFIQVGTEIEDDRLGGIMLASVAENGRTSIDTTNYYHIASAPAGRQGQYWIATATTANTNEYPGAPSGLERDVNVAVAYFPFDQGWTCGRVETYNDNTTNWTFVGSDNIELGVELTQLPQGDIDTNLLQKVGGATYWKNPDTYRGIWNLNLPGVDSINDGILLVCGGKNEDNYAAASPWLDGSGWQISVQDSGGSSGTESDPWNFVYVPYNTINIVAGRGGVLSGKTSGTDGFTMTSNGVGAVRLDITGYTPSDGTLIVSTENERFASDDFTTYEPEGDHWIIETRDLPGATLVGGYASTQFAFLFIPFASAPAEPGPSYDAFWTAASGDWMTETNWLANSYGVPGWVVGNPLNTGSSTDPDWNLAKAFIQTGTVNLTPASKPDGTVRQLSVGIYTGDSILNISSDLTVRENVYMGYKSKSNDVATINQTAGNVVFGDSGSSREYLGRGFGESVYNLSGGSLETVGAYTRFGNNYNDSDDGASTFTFNQTGGSYTDTGTNALILADVAGDSTTIVNISGGTFAANATESTRIGDHGTATMTVEGTGVFQSSSTYLGIGYYSTGNGTVNLKDTAMFTAHGDFFIGRSGIGTLNQSGGILVAEDFVNLGYYTTGAGTLNLSGGLFTVSNDFRIGYSGAGILNQTGGTLVLEDYSTFGYQEASTGTFNLIDGEFTAQTELRVGYNGIGTLNQSGGTSVINAWLRLGRNATGSGIFNLSGGTCTVTGSRVVVGYLGDGVINHSGGSFEVEDIRLADQVGSTGLYSISGGSLVADDDIYAAGSSRGVFEVVGSGATSIQVDSVKLYQDTFRVKLDAGGATLVRAVGGTSNAGIELRQGRLEVGTHTGFNGLVGDTYDIMWTAHGFSMDEVAFTNLNSNYTFSWAIVSKDGGQVLQLTLDSATSLYDQWAAGWDVDIGASTDDYDGDDLANLYEFGVGGDPTNALDQGHSTSSEFDGTWLNYVYPKRSASNSGLNYYLEITDSLIYGTWTNDTSLYTVTGTNTDGYAPGFDAISNQISTAVKDEQFIRLGIEEQ